MRRFRNAIGPQARKLRVRRGLTQERLAVKLQLSGLDLDRTAVAKIEAQVRSVYDFELAVLASVLGASPKDLWPSIKELRQVLPQLVAGRR
jgi:transcriptional regulator with XRE-family HTH domain